MDKRMNKKGQTAMGTLIIFIALVLTAAVAAAVLITTISSLQSRALETGKSTTQEIGTNLNFLELFGDRDGAASTVTNLTIVLKLAAGSENIRFNDMLLSIALNDSVTDYAYGTVFGGLNYTVAYSIQGTGHVDGYLVKGDVAKVKLEAAAAIAEANNIKISLIPKVGTPAYLYARTPDTISTTTVPIFP